MKLETQKDEMLVRYLLGDLSDEERQNIEKRFFKDDSYFEEMLALEDELMYDYKQGNLTRRDEELFETRFLRTHQDKLKADFAHAFLKTINDFAPIKEGQKKSDVTALPFWKPLLSLFSFQNPALQYGMAAAMLLVLLGGVWLFVKNYQLRDEVANLQKQTDEQNRLKQEIEEKQRERNHLEAQLAQEKQRRELDQEQITKLEEERAKLEKEIANAREHVNQQPKTAAPQKRSSVFATLVPGLFSRSGGPEMQTVNLTPNTKMLSLQLRLKRDDEYLNYQATLKTLDEDNKIWKSQPLKARGKGKNKTVSFQLPVNILQNADYDLLLEGVNGNGATELVDDYYFRVVKRMR